MDARQAGLLVSIDLAVLGRRLRAARVAAGLTQGQVAGQDVTVSYVSRIESGQRRPDARVLELLAARVATNVDDLLTGASKSDSDEIRLALNFAELALESGDGPEACRMVEELFQQYDEAALGVHAPDAQFTRSRALEAVGRLDDAVLSFQRMGLLHDQVTGWVAQPDWLVWS